MLILFNKPFGVLCQFSGDGSRPTLSNFIGVPNVYPAGRLDADSEGLVALTDDGALQARIADPRRKLAKTYWAQIEGVPSRGALRALAGPLDLGDFTTLPARVRPIREPVGLWPRDPPIRVRRDIPTSWVEITLVEGKNRQLRRMTAKVGHPTLRLVRARIGRWTLAGMQPGQWREVTGTPVL